MVITVYGIPTCSTVTKARKWLDSRGCTQHFIDFRKTPLCIETVQDWVARLGSKAMKNTSGGSYRALGPEKKTWTDAQWIRAFCDDPMLIKRPVIVRDGCAVQVGFRGTDDELAERILG